LLNTGEHRAVADAGAGIEQDKLSSAVDHQGVLLQQDVVHGEEIVGECLAHGFRGQTDKDVGGGRSEMQRAVRYDRGFERADVEAIKCRRLGFLHRRLGER
jgi:hypothetical protein